MCMVNICWIIFFTHIAPRAKFLLGVVLKKGMSLEGNDSDSNFPCGEKARCENQG